MGTLGCVLSKIEAPKMEDLICGLVSVPASPQLRWITAIALFAAAGLSIALPLASATLLAIAVGAAALIAGVSQVLRLTGEADLKGKVFRLLSGVFYLGGGIGVLAFPIESEVSLTLFVGFLLAFEGVMELAAAATSNAPARGLVLVDGIVTAVLGGMLIAQWPTDSLWAIGLLFGIGLAFSAVNLITAPSAPAN
jgi:membrane protein HdeD